MMTVAFLSNSFYFMDRPFLAYVIKIILFMITTVDIVNTGKTKNAENLHFTNYFTSFPSGTTAYCKFRIKYLDK
jgi:hypothetical protein